MNISVVDKDIYSPKVEKKKYPQVKMTHGDVSTLVITSHYRHVLKSQFSSPKFNFATIFEQEKVLHEVMLGLDVILDQPTNILCFSFGITQKSSLFNPFMETCIEKDILVIVPSGNKGEGTILSPGIHPEVLCVGAVDKNGQVANFSGRSHAADNCLKPDVAVLGVNVNIPLENDKVHQVSGTSMSCATVAGIAAALFDANPNATTNDVKVALFESCTPAAGSRYGVIDADKAMENILNKAPYATKPEQSKPPSFYGETYIDHRLKSQCKKAQKRNEKVEALVVADSTKGLMARLSENYSDTDFEFTLFRNFDMAHVTATPSFYEALFTQPDIQVCSAVDVNYFDL
jgi:hypothetical protein